MSDRSVQIPGAADGCEVTVYDVPDGSSVLIGILPYEISYSAECVVAPLETRARDVPEAHVAILLGVGIAFLVLVAGWRVR